MRARPPLFELFNPAVKKVDVRSIVMNLTSVAYHGLEDKGTQMLSDHINDVRDAAAAMYHGKIPRAEFDHLRLLAEAHEVGEIKDKNKKVIWTRERLLSFRHQKQPLPSAIVEGILRLAKKEGQPYLNYIHEIAYDVHCLRAKRADLRVNQSPDREKLNPEETSATFKDKKTFLYPCADAYLAAVESGVVDPRLTTPFEYITSQPSLVALIPGGDAGRLKAYWKADYTPPVAPKSRTSRLIDSLASGMRSLTL